MRGNERECEGMSKVFSDYDKSIVKNCVISPLFNAEYRQTIER